MPSSSSGMVLLWFCWVRTFLFEAYKYIASGLATTLIFLYPVMVAIIMVFLKVATDKVKELEHQLRLLHFRDVYWTIDLMVSGLPCK